MMDIFPRLHWSNVSIPKLFNKHLSTSKLVLNFNRIITKWCINKDFRGNAVVLKNEVICIESSENTGIFAGPYHQLCCVINRSLRCSKVNHPLGG